jgi:D-alanine-D-alanine ligase
MSTQHLRVLALVHDYLMPPADLTGIDLETAQWKMEHDVLSGLNQLGHEVHALSIADTLEPVTEAAARIKPHIVFNLLENLREISTFDQNVVSFLEVLRMAYTGCNPRGLMLSRDKAISKTLLAYHRIPVPEFAVYPVGHAIRRPKRLQFPLIVKSLTEDASEGISQASVVVDDQKLQERVQFIHDKIGTDALAERYIDGRELYVGVIGNQRLTTLPVWELHLAQMPESSYRIATGRVKWSARFQKKHGIKAGPATDLPEGVEVRIRRICKRVFRSLQLNGYARIDLRLDPNGRVYVLEANANPQLAQGEDLAESAKHAGISYGQLLQRIIAAGLSWRPERRG